jgi:hypothetical protein
VTRLAATAIPLLGVLAAAAALGFAVYVTATATHRSCTPGPDPTCWQVEGR